MGKSPRCDDTALKKGPWTPEEDEKLVDYIKKYGHGSWRALPKRAGLNRCGKSCRLRWINYLRPDIKRGKFSPEEEQTILNLHRVLGNKWSTIATHLPGRTDNEIKNFWNTHMRKKLIQMGFDPMTHRPRTDILSSFPHLIALANLKGLIEHSSWEQQALRLQNEAVHQMANLQSFQHLLLPPSSMPSFPNSINAVPNMDSHNLLNSLSSNENSLDLSPPFMENPNRPSFGIDNSSFGAMPFSHLPDLQAPCSFETSPDNKDNIQASSFAVLSHDENSPCNRPPWLSSSLSPSPAAPPTAEALNINVDGACSSSTSGGSLSSLWPDLLLENPLFHEVA